MPKQKNHAEMLTARVARNMAKQAKQEAKRQRTSILTMASQVQVPLGAARFEQKRYLFDLLDLRVQLRNDGAGRWLALVCILLNYVGALENSAI